jgi:hypothetical protein
MELNRNALLLSKQNLVGWLRYAEFSGKYASRLMEMGYQDTKSNIASELKLKNAVSEPHLIAPVTYHKIAALEPDELSEIVYYQIIPLLK